MKIALAAAIAIAAVLSVPSFAQDQKAPDQPTQNDSGMKGMEMMKNGMMQGDMMARMNKMMDRCEKMMGSGMHKGMRHHKKG